MEFENGDVVIYSGSAYSLIGVILGRRSLSPDSKFYRVRYWNPRDNKFMEYDATTRDEHLVRIGNVYQWDEGKFSDVF